MSPAATSTIPAASASASAAAAAGDQHMYYEYDPSRTAALVFTILFAIVTFIHIVQMGITRTWYMIPFVIGGILELGGYAARAVNANQTPDWAFAPFVVQTLFILLGPPLLAATIYMEFGRIILLIDGVKKSLVKPRWLTAIFVTGDVLSFLVQCGGGVLLTKDDPDMVQKGQDIVLVGLYIQIVFFGFFVLNALLFWWRMSRAPTVAFSSVPWRRHYLTILIGSALILIRSIYRVVEYVQGKGGELMSNEAYLYGLDAAVMWITVVIFNFWHPSAIGAMLNGGKSIMLWRVKRVEAYAHVNSFDMAKQPHSSSEASTQGIHTSPQNMA